jgi:transcriptional regulator
MTPNAFERMLRQIVPIALDIYSIEVTWRMSQNKPAPVCAAVVQGLATSPIGQNVSQISDLMSAALKEVTS